MTAEYVVMLAKVTLTTASALRVTENGAASTLTVIDPATGSALASTKNFYLRGDGSDDDLLQVLVETIQSHAGANTYTAAMTMSTDAASPSVTCTITATGGNNFQINWTHAGTTIEPSWFGFADSDTANDGNPKAGTKSSSVAWVSPEVPAQLEEHPEYDASVQRARSGRVRGVRRSGPYHVLDLDFALVDSRRVLRTDNTSDTDATFMAFLETVGDGQDFEIHTPQISSGTTLAGLTVYTRRRETWRFDEETSAAFRPAREQPGLSLYSFSLRAEGRGDTQVDPGLAEIVEGAIFIFDPDDGATLTLAGSEITDANDAAGGARDIIKDGGVVAFDPTPNLVSAVVNGRDIARFSTSGGTSQSYLRLRNTAGVFSSGSWFSGVNASYGSFTRFFALNFSSITTKAAADVTADCVIGAGAAGDHTNTLFVRGNGSGSYFAWLRAQSNVDATFYNSAEITLPGVSTWCVITHRFNSTTGVNQLRVDDGAWAQAALPAGNMASAGSQFLGVTGLSNDPGFNGDLAFWADYYSALTDDETDQMLLYIQQTVLGL